MTPRQSFILGFLAGLSLAWLSMALWADAVVYVLRHL